MTVALKILPNLLGTRITQLPIYLKRNIEKKHML
jgi:hypothetical protein